MPHTLTPFTIIFGPTASGKSARAYELANTYNTDVLSFDSRQVYQGMDIVTGKDRPPSDWPHTLFGIDLVTPDQDFSIRHYYEYAQPLLKDFRQRGQPLILVGGSWQYVQVLLAPPESLFVPQDAAWRQQATDLTLKQLQQQLRVLDPDKWASLNHSDQHNPRRLIRAVEVATHPPTPVPVPLIRPEELTLELLTPPVAELENKIADRIEQRLVQGALDETRFLIEKYPHWNTPAFSSTGYGPLRQFLAGTITEPEMKSHWLQQEREYAKRQSTWLRSLTDLTNLAATKSR